MSEERFTELVNLFLDEEISAGERCELQTELQRHPARKAEFESRCRLHRAMHFALLSPQERECLEARSKRFLESKKRCQLKAKVVTVGLAASVVVTATASVSYILTQSERFAEFELMGSEATSMELSDGAGHRYHRLNSTDTAHATGSVAAHLRLLGLCPGIVTEEPELRGVDLAAQADMRQARLKEIDRLNQMRGYSPVPEPALFQAVEMPSTGTRMPAGFDVSLASFK